MATKTFPYAVIWNGEIVPPNTPIEVKETKAETKPEKHEETPVKEEAPVKETAKKRGAK